MNNKIKIYIFHPYSMLGGADTSLSRLINNLDQNKYLSLIHISEPTRPY